MILQESQFYQNWTMDEQRAALKTFFISPYWVERNIFMASPLFNPCLLAVYQKIMAPIDQLLYKEVKLPSSIPILWECVHKIFGASGLNLVTFLCFLSLIMAHRHIPLVYTIVSPTRAVRHQITGWAGRVTLESAKLMSELVWWTTARCREKQPCGAKK